MSSDGRLGYMYHNPQAMAASYDYSPYPAPYDTTQIPQQPPARRPNSSESHSPHQTSAFNSPSAQYAPAPYAPYGIPPSAQWTGDNWNHYNQAFPPQSVAEVPFNSGPGRPEAPPNPPQDQRNYIPSQSSPDPRRADEHYASSPIVADQAKPRRRAKDISPTQSPSASPGLDFTKVYCFAQQPKISLTVFGLVNRIL